MTGTSFFLWVLECYPAMAKQVEAVMSEVKTSDEGLGVESSPCKSNNVCTKETESQRAQASYERIMAKLKSLNDDVKHLNQSLEDLSKAQKRHEEHTDTKYAETQERINFMNYRILEIRQLTGPGGLSKAHIARIRKMKRGSIFQDKSDNYADVDDEEEEMLKESEAIVKESVVNAMKKNVKRDQSPTKSRKPTRSKSPVKKPEGKEKNLLEIFSHEDNSEASSTKDSGFEEEHKNISPRKSGQNIIIKKPNYPKKKERSKSPQKSNNAVRKTSDKQVKSDISNKAKSSLKVPDNLVPTPPPPAMSLSTHDEVLADNISSSDLKSLSSKSVNNDSNYEFDEDDLFSGMM